MTTGGVNPASVEREETSMSESGKPLRVMAVMPHPDDFEITAGGTFALLRNVLGDRVALHVLCMSRGAAGHHKMSPDETFAVRRREAAESASLIGATCEFLTQLDGSHVTMQVLVTRNLLGGLWNAIRAFEPDVVFSPPLVGDPLAGVHVDHLNTAHAVRMVAYQLCAPHSYPTVRGPEKQRVWIPLILNVDDRYAGGGGFHVRQEITEVYDTKLKMAICHRSQMLEWLPWAKGHEGPYSVDDFRRDFRARHDSANERYGCNDGILSEYFQVTRWGRAPQPDELDRLFTHMIENRLPSG